MLETLAFVIGLILLPFLPARSIHPVNATKLKPHGLLYAAFYFSLPVQIQNS